MWLLYFWIATQIIIEMLPISSSAHLKIVEEWSKRAFSWNVEEYFKKRNIALTDAYYFFHLPTLLVILLYFSPYWLSWFEQPALLLRIGLRVLIADAITICFYYLFKKYSFFWPLIFGMSITALALLSTVICAPVHLFSNWSIGDAVILGVAQGIAFLPGISRLAFTTGAGYCLIFDSLFQAFFVSWLIYIPLMFAAIVKSSINLYQAGTLAQLLNWRICLVMLVSGVISRLVLSVIVGLIVAGKWWLLGWYMIIPIGLWVLLAYKKR